MFLFHAKESLPETARAGTPHRQRDAERSRILPGAVSLFCVAMSSVSICAARPQVTSVSLTHREGGRIVKIGYEISDEAIVSVDIRTNGVSIGASHYAGGLSGDVCRLVPAGRHTIRWDSRATWPGQDIPEACLTAVVTAWPLDYPPDYVVLDLSGRSEAARYYVTADEVPGGVTNRLYKTTKLLMRKIHAANRTFRMGRARGDAGAGENDSAHRVTLTNDFYLGVYPITQAQHRLVGGTVPSECPTCAPGEDPDLCPVGGCSFADLRGYLNDNGKRNSGYVGANSVIKKFMVATGCPVLDFPSEAEWEFACRAGATEALYDGTWVDADAAGVSATLARLAWYVKNSNGSLHEVGLKEPNAWGLYDMLGVVAECVMDWWKADLRQIASVSPFVPAAVADYGLVAFRGGSFLSEASDCTASRRGLFKAAWQTPQNEVGYRLARPIDNVNFN